MTSERLHPAAFLVATLSGLRETLLPAVVVFVASGRGLDRAAMIGLLAVVASGALGYVRWSRTTYWIEDDALHLRSGVLSPDQKTVPIARISAIDEVQGPVQRLFGVVALHVQTAGGGAAAEIVLTAVERGRADTLRAALGRRAAPPEAGGPTWRLGVGGLLVASVTGPQIGVAAPVVAGGAGIVSQSLGDPDAERLLERLPDAAGGWIALTGGALVALAALAFLGALVAFGGFTVAREPRRLRLRRGIVQRRAATIGIERVHAVRIVEGALRRPLGLCAVRLEVAGYAREAAAAQTLVPLCRRRDVAAVLARLLPELPAPTAEPERPPSRSTRRYLLPPAVAGGLAGAAVWAVLASAVDAGWGWLAALAGGGLVLGAALGGVRRRAAGWWLDGPVVAIRRHGVLARATTIATVARLQHTELRRSLLQRRARLATLGFAVASGHRVAVAHVELDAAEHLLGALRPGPAPPTPPAPVG